MGDFYSTLGVSKNADAKEIKSAYRKVAMKFHPDKNPGDSVSEEKFKEAAEAYSVLSDEQKRARYDQFGHSAYTQSGGGGGGGFQHMDMNDIFDHFGDIFSSSGFGSFFGGGGRGRGAQSLRGSDLKINIVLTMEEIYQGTEKTVKIKRFESCKNCRGNGSAPGSNPINCPSCQGLVKFARFSNHFLDKL